MNRPNIPSALSFDSRGINDKTAEYCDRLFTIAEGRVDEPCCQALGKAFSALPDLLAALEGVLSRAAFIDQSATHDGMENCEALAKARAALIKAGYSF